MKYSNHANHQTSAAMAYHKGHGYWRRDVKGRTGSVDFKQPATFRGSLHSSGKQRKYDGGGFENFPNSYHRRQQSRNDRQQLRYYKTQYQPWRSSQHMPNRLTNSNPSIAPPPNMHSTTIPNYFQPTQPQQQHQQSFGQYHQGSQQRYFESQGQGASASTDDYYQNPFEDPTTAVMAAMSCALVAKGEIQEMLMKQFTEQMRFEKNTMSADANQWPWVEEDTIGQMEDMPLEVIDSIETESRGNSIDRFIKNGYKDSDMQDDDYLSDQSLKNFLQDLGRTSCSEDKLHQTTEQLAEMSFDDHHQGVTSYEDETKEEQDITFEYGQMDASANNHFEHHTPADTRSIEDLRRSVKDNINLTNFFKSQQKACQSCNRRCIKEVDSNQLGHWPQSQESQICSKCQKQSLDLEFNVGAKPMNNSYPGEPTYQKQSAMYSGNLENDQNVRQCMIHSSFVTLNKRIERLTSNSYGVGVNRKRHYQNQKNFKE